MEYPPSNPVSEEYVTIDWERELERHKKELEDDSPKEKSEGEREYDISWKLMNYCVNFLRENDDNWKKITEQRKRDQEKMERLQRAAQKKREAKISFIQKKITENMERLPVRERERMEREEMRGNRKELQLIQKDLWRMREEGRPKRKDKGEE